MEKIRLKELYFMPFEDISRGEVIREEKNIVQLSEYKGMLLLKDFTKNGGKKEGYYYRYYPFTKEAYKETIEYYKRAVEEYILLLLETYIEKEKKD